MKGGLLGFCGTFINRTNWRQTDAALANAVVSYRRTMHGLCKQSQFGECRVCESVS
jgi:hypothetical protein